MKKDLPQDPELQVRLKPVFGIKPGVYLLVLYSLLIALAAFWLFLEPGIHRPGSLVSFSSTPPGSAVFTRDALGQERYWGATPVSVFIPEGNYALELRKENFKTSAMDLRVGNRLFFSRFLPETQLIAQNLTDGNLGAIQESFDRELSHWAVLGPSMGEYAYPALFSITRPKENWVGVSHPLPPLFTNLAADWIAAGGKNADLLQFLSLRLHWVSDPFLYRDLMLSLGADPLAQDFSTQLKFWREKTPAAIGLADWVLINQPYRERNALAQSQEFRTARENDQKALTEGKITESAPSPRVLAGLSFLGVPGGEYIYGNPTSLSLEPPFEGGRPVKVRSFLLGKTEVTNADFLRFIRAQEQWSPLNQTKLEVSGLVDEGYLAEWNAGLPPAGKEGIPVTGVSWYAAQAFAAWAESQAPGYAISLPLEEEWEWAARDAGQGKPWSGENLFRNLKTAESGTSTALGFRGLSGQTWEWTASDAAQASTLLGLGLDPHISLASSKKKTLRGGSYADPQVLSWSVRGFYDASWCTPYAGFRLLARAK